MVRSCTSFPVGQRPAFHQQARVLATARPTGAGAMAAVRETADRLEKVVADDLWPLPKYSEILFIK